MVIEVSVAVIALAFVILTIYLIVLIRDIRNQVNQISVDIREKSVSLDPVFKSIQNLGEVARFKTEAYKNEELALAALEKAEKNSIANDASTTVAAVLALTGQGIRLWQHLKKRS